MNRVQSTMRGVGRTLGRCTLWLGLWAAAGCVAPNDDASRVGQAGRLVDTPPEGVSTQAPERRDGWTPGPIRWSADDADEGAQGAPDPEQPAAAPGGEDEDTASEPPVPPAASADATEDAGPPGSEDPAATPDPAAAEDPAPAPDPDEEGRIEPWPVVADCAELQTTACVSNYTCAPTSRCEPVGSPEAPLRCCLPGLRARDLAGSVCADTGVDDCLSGLCLADADIRRCSLRCGLADCPYGMRHCAPLPDGDSDGALWCQSDGASGCAVAGPGDVIINEIMVFADRPEREHEFIELVNTTARPVALADLTLRSNWGDGLLERVAFDGGCLAAGARVAIYEGTAAWRWSAPPADPPVVRMRRFGFSNTADVVVELAHLDGTLVDRVTASVDLLRRGVSLNRATDASPGAELVPHDQVSLNPASPGEAP